MKLAAFLTTLAACAACVLAWHDDSHKPGHGVSDKVLLREVTTLTLYEGKMTNARRSRPVAQLKCAGGSAHCKSQSTPQVMQCYNKGWDGSDVNWECKAELDKSYRLGPVEVSCEGYDYPDDPYVLKGSCGAEYKLEITEHGRQAQQHPTYQKQQSGGWFGSWFGGSQPYQQQPTRQGWLSWLFGRSYSQPVSSQKKGWFGGTGTLAIIGLIVLVVYKKLIAPAAQQGAAPLRGGAHEEHWYTRYFPQGTTQNSNAAPPPPYGFHDAGSGSAGGGAVPPPYDDNRYKNPNIGGATASQRGGGGFWQGALSGAAMGYIFGNRGQRTQVHHQQSPYSGARSTMNETTFRPSETTSVSETHTSTSYGTTKRR